MEECEDTAEVHLLLCTKLYRAKHKINATSYGNKDFIPYLYARKQGRGGGGFHFFGVLIAFAICSCEVKRRKFHL